jgi:chromosome partitioning protein
MGGQQKSALLSMRTQDPLAGRVGPRSAARLFAVEFARDTLHREAPEIARNADHVVIDGPPRLAPLMRSALLAADLVVIPALAIRGWASGEILRSFRSARLPSLVARFVLNRCSVSVIARERPPAWPT